MAMNVEVRGAAAKIDALKRFDKSAWSGIQKGVKAAQEEITADARSRVPQMGLVPNRRGTGWGKWIEKKSGRDLSYNQNEFVFKTKFRSRVQSGFREVMGITSLDVKTPAVSIFVLAGSKDKSGHPFNRNINRQQGGQTGVRNAQMWPRLLTPARYAKGPVAAATIGRLIEQAVNQVNRAG